MRRSCRRLELFFVASVAVDGHVNVFVLLLVLMTLFAGRSEMRTDQWEPGLRMPLGHIRNQPRLRRVASIAGETQLSPVHILMAAFAFQWRPRKPEGRMAGSA
jgi:hypothetical protein